MVRALEAVEGRVAAAEERCAREAVGRMALEALWRSEEPVRVGVEAELRARKEELRRLYQVKGLLSAEAKERAAAPVMCLEEEEELFDTLEPWCDEKELNIHRV